MGSLIKKYMISHAHPIKFISEILGIIFATYFLWNGKWILSFIVAMFFFSTLLLWRRPLDYLEKTTLGKILLVYSKPLNFLLYNFSVIPYIYGIWNHDFLYIIIGIFLLVLPLILTRKIKPSY